VAKKKPAKQKGGGGGGGNRGFWVRGEDRGQQQGPGHSERKTSGEEDNQEKPGILTQAGKTGKIPAPVTPTIRTTGQLQAGGVLEKAVWPTGRPGGVGVNRWEGLARNRTQRSPKDNS